MTTEKTHFPIFDDSTVTSQSIIRTANYDNRTYFQSAERRSFTSYDATMQLRPGWSLTGHVTNTCVVSLAPFLLLFCKSPLSSVLNSNRWNPSAAPAVLTVSYRNVTQCLRTLPALHVVFVVTYALCYCANSWKTRYIDITSVQYLMLRLEALSLN